MSFIPIEEYLDTSYSPDREYIDGEVIERNLGEKTHSKIQRKLTSYLDTGSKEFGVEVFPRAASSGQSDAISGHGCYCRQSSPARRGDLHVASVSLH